MNRSKQHKKVTAEELIYNIHGELHARTSISIEAPAQIRHTAYNFSAEDKKAKNKIIETFNSLLVQLNIKKTDIRHEERSCFAEKSFAEKGRLLLMWEMHTEFYSYTTIFIPKDKASFYSKPYSLPEFYTAGKKILDLSVLIVSGLKLTNKIQSFLHEGTLYGGYVLNGEASVYTTFQINELGQERYVILSGKLSSGRLGRLVRRIIEIENYSHLILLPLTEYKTHITRLRNKEKRIAEYSEQIAVDLAQENIDAQKEQLWIVKLTRSLAELIRLTENMRYRFSAASSYYRIFIERLKWLREKTGEGYQSIDEFLTARVSPAVRNYENFIDRSEALASQLTALGNMIRTRINQIMERQNLKTLEAMNKRVKLQIMLQETVEGLSIIVLSYYMTSLSSYIFQAIDKLASLPGDYKLWTAFSVPVWLITAFFITKRAKKLIAKKAE
ncbi:MAG: DUF3422 domain-containing protein [Spirochaetia bacterium]|nr:DUF3422 domain-containing protein [Spirochaetia bacterium]